MFFVEIFFLISVFLIFYTLSFYPILTVILACIFRKKVNKQQIWPKVSFIIAAYNEESGITKKIEETLELDYPKEKLEIIVASDGSTDKTDDIVKSYTDRGIILNRVEGRKGKTNTLNETVKITTGEILVFSDATGEFNKESIKELVANFNDPKVGCVTGRVAYSYGKDTTSKGFKLYQKFAVFVRKAETYFGSQTSVSGAIHAVRKDLFKACPIALSPDVVDAVHTVAQGYRVVYENNAVALEESRTKIQDEFKCRKRISTRGTSMIPYIFFQLFKKRKLGYLFQMISHKFCRWWLWCWLLIAFISNLIIINQNNIYFTTGIIQIVFYSLGILGLILNKINIKTGPLSSIAFFVMANTAMSIGAVNALKGKKMASWEPVR